ncbi:MAG: hypothetical protein ACLTBX_01525 [Clostridia bacterium]
MTDQEIIQKWKQGLSKNNLAKIYKREYNMQIRNIRATPRHRHDGKFLTNYEALSKVEEVIYRYLQERR